MDLNEDGVSGLFDRSVDNAEAESLDLSVFEGVIHDDEAILLRSCHQMRPLDFRVFC